MKRKNQHVKKLIAAALALSMVALTGCSTFTSFKTEFGIGKQTAQESVKIGIYEPQTGADKEQAAKEIQGIELAYSMYPTCDGKRVELVYADNRSDITVAETAIQDLIEKEPVVILGSYGEANTLAAAEYITEAQIPSIAITCTTPLITKTSDYYFRVCYTETYQGYALAGYAYHKGAKNAAVVVPQGDQQAASISQRFISRFVKLTKDENAITANLVYESGTRDYSDLLKRLSESKVKEVLLIGSVNDSAELIRQADEKGLDLEFLGTDSWNDKELYTNLGGRLAAKVAFTRVSDVETADANTSASEGFLEAFHTKYGEETVPDNAVALGYDAYLVAIRGITQVGSEAPGETLKDAILGIDNFEGASGNFSFDVNGDPVKNVAVYTIDETTGENLAVCQVLRDGTVKDIEKK